MLAQQQHVRDRAAFARRHQPPLQIKPWLISHQPEINHPARFFARVQRLHFLFRVVGYALIVRPITELNASPIASHTVGCAWIIAIMSSIVPSSCSAVVASAMISVDSDPIECTPSTSLYFSSDTTLMNPS